MNWFLWIVLSNTAIAIIEYIYRTSRYKSFIEAFPYIIIPILIGQVGLFYGFRSAPNLLFAGAVFTVINVSIRICTSTYIGESLNMYNWCGAILLVAATVLLKLK